jgi:hypothetical protein
MAPDPDRTIRGFYAWIEDARNGFPPGPDSEELNLAFIEVAVDLAKDDPEVLWPIIVRMVAEAADDYHLGIIGATPLEDLLWFHGPEFVDRIEATARTDARFRKALDQVSGWGSQITPQVTERLRPYINS